VAATDAIPVPKKSTAYRLYFDFRKSDGTIVTSVTGADTELSGDGAAFADATNEFTEIGTSGPGYIDLTAGEMGYDAVIVKATCTNTSALPVTIFLYPQEGADIDANISHWKGTVLPTPDTVGYPKVTIKNGTGTGEVSLSSGRANADMVYVNGAAVSTSTAQLGVNTVQAGGTAWGSGAITAASIATDAITAAKIAADAIGASELAADAVTEIVTAIAAKVVESEGSYTIQQVLSLLVAALAGVTASGGSVLKTPNGVATRITATVDGSNNRTAMTLTPSS
jgi:hypothetical protein